LGCTEQIDERQVITKRQSTPHTWLQAGHPDFQFLTANRCFILICPSAFGQRRIYPFVLALFGLLPPDCL
jgi:hypothetical protein